MRRPLLSALLLVLLPFLVVALVPVAVIIAAETSWNYTRDTLRGLWEDRRSRPVNGRVSRDMALEPVTLPPSRRSP